MRRSGLLSAWGNKRYGSGDYQVKFLLMSISGACILIALAFMWWRDFNTAFIVAIVGVLAWFWNYRMEMKKIAVAADAAREREAEEENEQE
jgi:hypothetical protein